MGRYLIRRLLWAFLTLWGLATFVFFLLRLFPGGPFDEDLALNSEIKNRLEQVYGISDSVISSYFSYLRSCLEGNFGVSLYFPGQSVATSIARGIQAGLLLNINALILAILLGFILGILPHLFPERADFFRWLLKIGLSLPVLFLAPLTLWILCFQWSLFPIRVDDSLSSYFLPVFLLAVRPLCGMARILDSQLRQASTENYARTFLALGASPQRLVWRWLVRGCLPAFLQHIPALAAGLISGSLVIEPLFGVHGLGMQLRDSLMNRDWSLALGLTLFFGVILIVAQILTDAGVMLIDPRVVVK